MDSANSENDTLKIKIKISEQGGLRMKNLIENSHNIPRRRNWRLVERELIVIYLSIITLVLLYAAYLLAHSKGSINIIYPPSNLTITVRNGNSVLVSWEPPMDGQYSDFRLHLMSFDDANNSWDTVIPGNAAAYFLRDLIPGATYILQLFTVLCTKESSMHADGKFTMKPNKPDDITISFRNETALLVKWIPSSKSGIYTHYKVSINPQDATESTLYVEKKLDCSKPAEAAFDGLIPGRAYSVSVQTVSRHETSNAITVQSRTSPLKPMNVTVNDSSITSTSFSLFWSPPNGTSEFEKYQISLTGERGFEPVIRNREDNECKWNFQNLEPGKTYEVVVKTLSGEVSSLPVSKNVTLRKHDN